MTGILEGRKHSLRTVGQFDLADVSEQDDVYAREPGISWCPMDVDFVVQ